MYLKQYLKKKQFGKKISVYVWAMKKFALFKRVNKSD